MSVREAARLLSVSVDTLTRWCKKGVITAYPITFGTKHTYQIPYVAIEQVKYRQERASFRAREEAKQRIQEVNHQTLIKPWLTALERGTFNGNPFSLETITDYKLFVTRYFKHHSAISAQGLERELNQIPSHRYANREHYYKAVLCLAKFLVHKRALLAEELEGICKLRPKKNPNPKRQLPTEQDVQSLLAAAKNPEDKALVSVLIYTGIRASELCGLKWEHIDFESARLTVAKGKGNKSRPVGMNTALIEILKAYQTEATGLLFKDTKDKMLTRNGVLQRLARLCRSGSINRIAPHDLRRYFATKNAMAGRPLPMLQRVLGHSSVRTTEQYIRATSLQAAEDMKGWD